MTTRTIKTTRFGDIELEADRIIQFIKPIFGFEHIQEYALFEHGDDSPFFWLQAVTEPSLAFVTTNPMYFDIPYEFTLPEEVRELLKLDSTDELTVLNIVSLPADNPQNMTANLLAPILINSKKGQAFQYVLNDTNYTTKTRLLPADVSTPAQASASSSQPMLNKD